MRRLLALVMTGCLAAGLLFAVPALAASRLPNGITTVSVTITFPSATLSGNPRTVHRTVTKASAVAEAVRATDALSAAKRRGVCPMFLRAGPVLVVVFRNAQGADVASAEVQATQGSKGDSGSSACWPIRLIRSGKTSELLGNGWVRLMGNLAGTSIS